MIYETMLQIREYQTADRVAVIRLWKDVFPDAPGLVLAPTPERILAPESRFPKDCIFIAEQDNEIVGAMMAGYDGMRGWLYLVGVAPASRRQGVGRRLMEAAEEKLRSLGCVKVNLQVRAGNNGVVGFYERLGYSIEERVSMGKRF